MDAELSLVLCCVCDNVAMETFGIRHLFVNLCEEDMSSVKSYNCNTSSKMSSHLAF